MQTETNNLTVQPLVSILVPTYNEEKYIANCLDSLLEQDYPKEKLEIFIVDGDSTDKTKVITNDYIKQYARIYLLRNPKKTVPYALNIGIEFAKGDVIIRIDAHSLFPKNYVSELVYHLFNLNADNVGGILHTKPGNSTLKANSIAICLSSTFGVGNSFFRTGHKKILKVDTVPFGCFKKSVFQKVGLFDTDLTRNQDDEFNARIIKKGGSIYLIPDVVIDYHSRTSFKNTAKMLYQYGLFKPLVNMKLGSPATFRQFFPLFFLLGLIFGLGLSYIHSVFLIIYFFVLSVYVILAFYFSIKEGIKHRKPLLIFLLPITFLIIHLSYGMGYLIGLFQFVLLRSKSLSVKTSR